MINNNLIINFFATKYADYTVSHVIKYENNSAEPLVYFVDLVKAGKEVVLKAVPNENLAFFQAIK